MITFEEFLREQLQPPPARVLEVGCGQGELTTALSVAGYDAVGIDPAAPEGDLFRRLKLDDLEEPDEPFDAIVAGRSLHHLRDLEAGLDKILRLLREDGLLVLDEFAWDRMDESTLDWLYGQRRALAAAGHGEAPTSLDELRSEWEEEHVGLHGYAAMRAALDERLEQRAFGWTPYLHRSLGGAASAVLEQALVDAGAIQALGFRYAGTPKICRNGDGGTPE